MNNSLLQALHRADTAVDFQLGAGHKLAFITRQIQDRIRNIVRLADFTEWDLASEFREAFLFPEHLLHAVQDGRVDKDGVD